MLSAFTRPSLTLYAALCPSPLHQFSLVQLPVSPSAIAINYSSSSVPLSPLSRRLQLMTSISAAEREHGSSRLADWLIGWATIQTHQDTPRHTGTDYGLDSFSLSTTLRQKCPLSGSIKQPSPSSPPAQPPASSILRWKLGAIIPPICVIHQE